MILQVSEFYLCFTFFKNSQRFSFFSLKQEKIFELQIDVKFLKSSALFFL